MKKILNSKGIAIFFPILIIAIIIMLFLILTPSLDSINEAGRLRIDKDYENAAYDSANLQYITSGGPFTYIYDSENKAFIDSIGSLREFDSITTYGEAKDHKDKLILVECDSLGNIKLSWIGRDDYKLVNFD